VPIKQIVKHKTSANEYSRVQRLAYPAAPVMMVFLPSNLPGRSILAILSMKFLVEAQAQAQKVESYGRRKFGFNFAKPIRKNSTVNTLLARPVVARYVAIFLLVCRTILSADIGEVLRNCTRKVATAASCCPDIG
jgi:hypothetical protein